MTDIRVYKRKEILPEDVDKFQADIVSQSTMEGFDHHGVGRTPAEALLRAAQHWFNHERYFT